MRKQNKFLNHGKESNTVPNPSSKMWKLSRWNSKILRIVINIPQVFREASGRGFFIVRWVGERDMVAGKKQAAQEREHQDLLFKVTTPGT